MNDLWHRFSAFLEVTDSRHSVPPQLLYLLLVLGILIFLWDLFDRRSKTIHRNSGLDEKAQMIALKGSSQLPSREYVSSFHGLSSKPDALLKIDGYIIPVDRKPMGKKVRDRHIVQLLVHMRLIEEIEGVRPPYGILLLGPEVKTVRVQNTEQRQHWLDTLLQEMESIIDGVPARPAPAPMKCKSCDVRSVCQYSAYRPKEKDNRPGVSTAETED